MMKKSFSVRASIRSLLNTNKKPSEREFHLRRILAWGFLDQALDKGKKIKKRPKAALAAGRTFLGKRGARELIMTDKKAIVIERQKWLPLYLQHGGIAATLRDPSSADQVKSVINTLESTMIVTSVVDYLVRARSKEEKIYRTTKMAFAFLQNRKLINNKSIGIKSYEKIWGEYARGSAIVYAAHKFWPCLVHLHQSENPLKKVEATLKSLSRNPKDLRRFLELIAEAADSLVGRKAYRSKSFADIPRMQVDIHAFSEADDKLLQELALDLRPSGLIVRHMRKS